MTMQAVPIDLNVVSVSPTGQSPHLIGSRCDRCKRYFFPKKEICPVCFDKDTVKEFALNPRGSLVSYTVVRKAQGRKVPYALGYVKTKEGIIVFAPLIDCDVERFRIGMEMEISFYVDEIEGKQLILYEYKPVEESAH